MNMNSDLKQLVMAVSLGCMGASPAFAGTNSLAVSATQQTSTCTGVVVDDLGETVIGASVIIKGILMLQKRNCNRLGWKILLVWSEEWRHHCHILHWL